MGRLDRDDAAANTLRVLPVTGEHSETVTYQVMPPLSEADYAALKADIAERGKPEPCDFDGLKARISSWADRARLARVRPSKRDAA